MAITMVEKIDTLVRVRNVLVSVSNKTGLERFAPELLAVNPDIRFFSTGGTHARLADILGPKAQDRLIRVSDYTGQPETQGGLVKTLDFKIYLGLLTETYNPAHNQDMERTGALALDMVVVNLYPFEQTIAQPGVVFEQARGNIDIGGPCMIRAAAKNLLRVAAVVDPADYDSLVSAMRANSGCIPLGLRFQLARKAFAHTADYDRAIADFLRSTPAEAVESCYTDAQASA